MNAPPSVRDRIAEIIAPLQNEAAKIDAEIEQREQELVTLKDQRRQVQAILQRANGTPLRKPGPKSERKEQHSGSAKWIPAVREFIAKMDEDGLTISNVHEAMSEEYDRRGLRGRKRPGYESVKIAMRTMHDNGELRIVRKSTGGHPVYTPTAKGE